MYKHFDSHDTKQVLGVPKMQFPVYLYLNPDSQSGWPSINTEYKYALLRQGGNFGVLGVIF